MWGVQALGKERVWGGGDRTVWGDLGTASWVSGTGGTEGEAWILTGDRRGRHSRLRGQVEQRQRGGRLGQGGWKKKLRRKAGQAGGTLKSFFVQMHLFFPCARHRALAGDRAMNQADTQSPPSHTRTQILEPRVRRGEPSVRTWAGELLLRAHVGLCLLPLQRPAP